MKTILTWVMMIVSLTVEAQTSPPAKGGKDISIKPLQLQPAKPRPGDRITVRYNPSATILAELETVYATAYLMEGTLPLAVEITLKKDKGAFTGTFATNDSTRAVFISFTGGEAPDAAVDNNQDKGYYISLYDNAGKEVMGARSAIASGFSSYNTVWRMKRDTELAARLNKKEFSNPVARRELYKEYWSFLARSGDSADRVLLRKELEARLAKEQISEADLSYIKDMYETVFEDQEKTIAVAAMIRTRFPDGLWKIDEFREMADQEKRVALFKELANVYPRDKEHQQVLGMMAQMIADRYADSGAYDKVDPYLPYFKDRARVASFYNHFAGKLAGGINSKPLDLAKGLEFSKRAIELMQEEIKAPSAKPSFMTLRQFVQKQKYSYHGFLVTHGTLLYHNNEGEKAYGLQKQAVEFFNGNNVIMNQTFALLTEKVKGTTEAQKILERFISQGKASPSMKEQLKRIYMKDHTAAEFADYMEQLENATYRKMKEDLSKKMINTPAPAFSLKNMAGETVSLASLKGKVVVVDFWSMWCGPCKRSFPAMQKLVDKYRRDTNVQFVFINTWETGTSRETDVMNFLKENNYSFTVLYDNARKGSISDFVVVSDYKVSGIPTKFVIDKKGNMRFRSSGFNGSIDGLTSEVTAMIELAMKD